MGGGGGRVSVKCRRGRGARDSLVYIYIYICWMVWTLDSLYHCVSATASMNVIIAARVVCVGGMHHACGIMLE